MTIPRAVTIVAGAALAGLAVGWLHGGDGMPMRLTIVGGCLGFAAANVVWLVSLWGRKSG